MKRAIPGALLLACGLVLPSGVSAQDTGEEGTLDGSVEVVYRNVSVDGSERKYDEDFDGLDSGVRLASFDASWLDPEGGPIDHARIEVRGLGGDPHERTWLRLGRKDVYRLEVDYSRHDYLYDLFGLAGDLDGSTWDTERRRSTIDLELFPAERVKVFFRYHDGRRSGDSLVMKDINRQLFRLDTPLDQTVKRYTAGADFRIGEVDLFVRHTLQHYDNDSVSTALNDGGILPGEPATLDVYEWNQQESGSVDLTTVRAHVPFGRRADLTVGVQGSFLSDEELSSRVRVDAEGLDFNGAPFVVDGGFADTRLDGDTLLVDADLTVMLADPVDLHLQYRSLDRDLEGTAQIDLGGAGPVELVDTRHEYSVDTVTALLDYRPVRELRLRGGYRLIQRELVRDGFGDPDRNRDYDSGDDGTVIFGIVLRPVDWFRLNADVEEGDIDQPFTAVGPAERSHTRARAVFQPQEHMRIDLTLLEFDYENTGPDLRDPGARWDTDLEGRNWSVAFWHRANRRLDYLLRYARQSIDNSVGVNFDLDAVFATDDGDSIFDNDNTQYLARIGCEFSETWDGYLRYWLAESDGNNLLIGDAVGLFSNRAVDQEFMNVEAGLTYSFRTGLFVGGSVRRFDFANVDGRQDYDGEIVALRLGTRF